MTITGYTAPTLERAKEIADKELRKYGHVCNGACDDWIEDLSALGRTVMKQMTGETRCEKCSEILLTDYEENGVSYSIFHERLKITTRDKSQSRFGLCCPTCDHTTDCIMTFAP